MAFEALNGFRSLCALMWLYCSDTQTAASGVPVQPTGEAENTAANKGIFLPNNHD